MSKSRAEDQELGRGEKGQEAGFRPHPAGGSIPEIMIPPLVV